MADEPIEIDVEDQVEDDGADEGSTIRRKKDIVDHVAQTTGLKKRDVREALDAAFGYVNAQLADGKDIAYPTLGKIKVHVQRAEGPNPKTQIRVVLSKPSTDEGEADETSLDGDEADA